MMLNILLFSFLLELYHKMVSPQNGDTRGGPPPPPPLSDATAGKCRKSAGFCVVIMTDKTAG